MMPSLNYSKRDPKFKLLKRVFDVIGDRKSQEVYARYGVKNIKMMIFTLKVIYISMFFNYNITDTLYEINKDPRLKKFIDYQGDIPAEYQVYNYLSYYTSNTINNITNSLLKNLNNGYKNRYHTLIVDATPICCDINTIKQYITKEKVEKLKLKWGYSTTKNYYIGFKATMVLDEKTLSPISILIHPGTPHDTVIFPEVLKELKRRRLIKPKDIIIFDRGYYSKENYNIGITQYKIIPLIFPKKTNKKEELSKTIDKLLNSLSYPLEMYKQKNTTDLKKLYQSIKKILRNKLNNWNDYKPIRGKIEDFFKIVKKSFGLDKIHKYTAPSIQKTVYLTILLTTIVIQQGYTTKTSMQQLAEGKINHTQPKKKTKKTKDNKQTKKEKTKVPYKTQQPTLTKYLKEKQTTLEKILKI